MVAFAHVIIRGISKLENGTVGHTDSRDGSKPRLSSAVSLRRMIITMMSTDNRLRLLSSATLQENMENMLVQKMIGSNRTLGVVVQNQNIGPATKRWRALQMLNHQLRHTWIGKLKGAMKNLYPADTRMNCPREVVILVSKIPLVVLK